MKQTLMTFGVLLAMTPFAFAQAPSADAVDTDMVLADIQPRQTVDPMITGSTPDAVQINSTNGTTPALQLCNTACQMERLNKWRTIGLD